MDPEERTYYIDRVHRTPTAAASSTPQTAKISIGTSMRKIPPADYILKINQFSFLSEAVESGAKLFSADKHYASSSFEAGGYKWCLVLYPNGDIERDFYASDYISLYLILLETTALPDDLEIKVDFKLFVYNQIADEYLAVEDAEGKFARCSKRNTQIGYSRFISKEDFVYPLNGYLVGDECSFGAEIFIVGSYRIKDECISTFRFNRGSSLYTWKLANFNTDTESAYKSDVFCMAEKNWVLEAFIKETLSGKKHLGLCLHMIPKEYKPRVYELVPEPE